MRFVMSVTGEDRPGIVAALTRVCYELGGNLEDASMTILAGEFAMILLVSFSSTNDCKALKERIRQLEKRKQLTITIHPPHRSLVEKKRAQNTIPYLISVFGKDRAGIVYRVSGLLAKHGFNITDLDSKLIHSKKKNIYGLLLEVDIPEHDSVKRFEMELKQLASRLKVDLSFKRVEPVTL